MLWFPLKETLLLFSLVITGIEWGSLHVTPIATLQVLHSWCLWKVTLDSSSSSLAKPTQLSQLVPHWHQSQHRLDKLIAHWAFTYVETHQNRFSTQFQFQILVLLEGINQNQKPLWLMLWMLLRDTAALLLDFLVILAA